MANLIKFEHPLNERSRILLRIEFVFARIRHFLDSPSAWDAQAAVLALIEAANLFSRSDIKSELIKELKRIGTLLSRFEPHPNLDTEELRNTITKLEKSDIALQKLMRQIGRHLHDNDFFKSVMQRSSIPGGTCGFDLPQYHLWLNMPPEERKSDLHAWFEDFEHINEAVKLLLKIYRESGESSQEKAEKGFFMHKLATTKAVQLIVIELEDSLRVFPEISGDRHRFNIRFRHLPEKSVVPETCKSDLPFKLTISAI